MITTLVVDDDFRVARIHAAAVDGVEGFRCVGEAHTGTACTRCGTRPPPGSAPGCRRPSPGAGDGRRCRRSRSASEVAQAVGISRPTAQRYLADLERRGLLRLELEYGATGRPVHRYVVPRRP